MFRRFRAQQEHGYKVYYISVSTAYGPERVGVAYIKPEDVEKVEAEVAREYGVDPKYVRLYPMYEDDYILFSSKLRSHTGSVW